MSVGRGPMRAMNFVEAPDSLADRFVVAVDQQRAAGVLAVPGEVHFTDQLGGNVEQPCGGVEADVVRADHDIVNVDQQLAAASASELAKEAGLAHRCWSSGR